MQLQMLLQFGMTRKDKWIKMKFFDTHSHYNDEQFKEDCDDIIEKIYDAGVKNAVVVGDNIENSKKAIEIAKKYDFLYASVRYTSK